MATSDSYQPLTWDEIVEHCSRLHTTRQRPVGPWPDAEMREDSQMLDVLVADVPGQIVPTRMHEPGFYWRLNDEGLPRRSDLDMRDLRALVDAGEVRRA